MDVKNTVIIYVYLCTLLKSCVHGTATRQTEKLQGGAAPITTIARDHAKKLEVLDAFLQIRLPLLLLLLMILPPLVLVVSPKGIQGKEGGHY